MIGPFNTRPFPTFRISPIVSHIPQHRYPLPSCHCNLSVGKRTNCILVHCDNEATVQCIYKGRSHSPALMTSYLDFNMQRVHGNFQTHPRGKNLIADSIDRFLFPKFKMLAPEADLHPTRLPHYSELILL